MKIKIITLVFICFMLSTTNIFAQTSRSVYYRGVRAARSGKKDFAFMYFRDFLQSAPDSPLAESALFALGEYYYFSRNPSQSAQYFNRFITRYPRSKAKIFACSYLLDMARKSNRTDLAKRLEREIVTFYKLRLVFSKYKRFTYNSAFDKKYKALYYMNKVEIYIDGELFTQIVY